LQQIKMGLIDQRAETIPLVLGNHHNSATFSHNFAN
jgi:hypothetical protein